MGNASIESQDANELPEGNAGGEQKQFHYEFMSPQPQTHQFHAQPDARQTQFVGEVLQFPLP